MTGTSLALTVFALSLGCSSSETNSLLSSNAQLVSSFVSQRLADVISAKGRQLQAPSENPCSLCADGSNYTIEGTLPPTEDGSVSTCAEANASAPTISSDDPVCSLLHIMGRHCGCPHVAPEGACNVCYDGSPVKATNVIDISAIELTGVDVTIDDLGLPDGSGAEVSCGEVETNLHTLHLLGELAESDASNVDIEKEEGYEGEYDDAVAYLCTFFQNFAGPQCGCPENPNADLCVACPDGVYEPDKVTTLGDETTTCGDAHELIKPVPNGPVCDILKANPPPGCSCKGDNDKNTSSSTNVSHARALFYAIIATVVVTL